MTPHLLTNQQRKVRDKIQEAKLSLELANRTASVLLNSISSSCFRDIGL